MADIRQGAFGGSAALQPGDFQATPTPAAVASLGNPGANGDWSEGTLKAAGMAAVNRSGLTQFRVYFSRDDDDNVEDSFAFRSGNDSDASSRPQLIVVYHPYVTSTAPLPGH